MPCYGVHMGSSTYFYNVKQRRKSKDLLEKDQTISIMFDPMKQKAVFRSKEFEYYQDNIVENENYRFVFGMVSFP